MRVNLLLQLTLPVSSMLFVAGCYGDVSPFVPVEGRVFINGKPLENATIHFTPEAEKGLRRLVPSEKTVAFSL